MRKWKVKISNTFLEELGNEHQRRRGKCRLGEQSIQEHVQQNASQHQSEKLNIKTWILWWSWYFTTFFVYKESPKLLNK